jgi:hypothetical protein
MLQMHTLQLLPRIHTLLLQINLFVLPMHTLLPQATQV